MRRVLAAFLVTAMAIATWSAAVADQTGAAGIHDWTKVGGRTCMTDHYHSGSGEGRSKAAARKAAIGDWQAFTAFEYGSSWARFSLAAGKSVSYARSAGGWTASVEARPCIGRR